MKKKLTVVLLIVAVVATFSFAGCGSKSSSSSSKETGGTVVVRAVGDPMTFNPNLNADDNLYPISENMFQRLCAIDSSKENLVPEAATEWKYTNNSKTLTFKLRDDLKWSDGEQLTSKDVKYTFDTMKADATNFMSASLQIVDSIDTPDDYTVVFNLTKPDASFLSVLGWYGTFIMPEHVYNNGKKWADNDANTKPVTCGPFKFSSYKQGESVTLVRDDNYPVKAKIDKLIFSIIPDEATALEAFKNGEIDFYENFPTSAYKELKSDSNTRVIINEYPSPIRMVFNYNNKTLAKLNVRKAIAMAIDRDEISDKVFAGIQKPEYNFYPSLVKWATNSEDVAPSYDLKAAEQLLKDAGYTKNSDGMYITGMTIDVFEGSGYPDTAKLIKASLAKIGIDVKVVVSEYNAWDQKCDVNHDFDILLMGGFMGPDPSALKDRVGTKQGSNMGSYSNAKVDSLLEKAAAISDQDTRATYYKQVQTILSQDLPYVNIVEYAGPEAYSTKYKNYPYDCAGKCGWANFEYTELAN